MKCYEINLLFIEPGTNRLKDIRQYFHQNKGSYQALQDTFAYVRYKIKTLNDPNLVVHRISVFEWSLDMPRHDGNITTRRYNEKVMFWTSEDGIVTLDSVLSSKQKGKVREAAAKLNQGVRMRTRVKIEDIGRDIMEGVRCLGV